MANPFLGVRIPPDLNEALLARMQKTGQSKSEIVVDALRIYFGLSPQQDRLDSVEERLSALEIELGLVVPRTPISSHSDPSEASPQFPQPYSISDRPPE